MLTFERRSRTSAGRSPAATRRSSAARLQDPSHMSHPGRHVSRGSAKGLPRSALPRCSRRAPRRREDVNCDPLSPLPGRAAPSCAHFSRLARRWSAHTCIAPRTPRAVPGSSYASTCATASGSSTQGFTSMAYARQVRHQHTATSAGSRPVRGSASSPRCLQRRACASSMLWCIVAAAPRTVSRMPAARAPADLTDLRCRYDKRTRYRTDALGRHQLQDCGALLPTAA